MHTAVKNEAKQGIAAVKKERSLVKTEHAGVKPKREASVEAEFRGRRRKLIEEKLHGIPVRTIGSRTRAQVAHERVIAQADGMSDAQQEDPFLAEIGDIIGGDQDELDEEDEEVIGLDEE